LTYEKSKLQLKVYTDTIAHFTLLRDQYKVSYKPGQQLTCKQKRNCKL